MRSISFPAYCVALAMALFSFPACGLQIRTNQKVIIPTITRDVQIFCHEDTAGKGTRVEEIVLMATRGNATAVPVAAVNVSRPYNPTAFADDVSVYGYAGPGRASFLLAVWRDTTFNTSGTYQCKALKAAAEGKTDIESAKLEIKDQLDEFCSKLDGKFKLENPERRKNIKSLLQRITVVLGNKTDILEKKMDKWFHRFEVQLSTLAKKKRKQRKPRALNLKRRLQKTLRQWPKGNYALLMTDEGCPLTSGFPWQQGYFKHHTESSTLSKNRDDVSPKNNFAKPVRQSMAGNNFVFTRYCSKTTNTSGPTWPKGHYCINRVGRRCPRGFKTSYLVIDNEDDDRLEENFKGPDGLASRIFYCCRDDGDVKRSVILPTTHPFFLYRFGGECQAVRGMNVSVQWMYLDTEDLRNGDKYQNEFHPDGQASDGVKLFACHYRRPRYNKSRSNPSLL